MPFHVAAFAEGIAAAGTLQPIAAVPDDQIFTEGDDLRVPPEFQNVLAAWAFGTGASRTRLVAPSLRSFTNHELAPSFLQPGVDVTTHRIGNVWARMPLPLQVGESLNFESDGGAAGPEDVTGVVLLGSGPVQPVEGSFRTMRATAAATPTRRTWGTSNLTFSEDLPAGRYQVIGGRCQGANINAWRLIFREGGHRPGFLATTALNGSDLPEQRRGKLGVWGEFDINQPPTLEVLAIGATATTQVVYLDLVRIGG